VRLCNRHHQDVRPGNPAHHQPVARTLTLVFVELRLIAPDVPDIFPVHPRLPDEVGLVFRIPLERVTRVQQGKEHPDVGSRLDHCGTLYHMRLTTCMLADGARQGPDAKLYIFGGQWDRVFAPTTPITHPTMTVVLVVEVAYQEAMKDHRVEIELVNADGAAMGYRAGAGFRLGHPAGIAEGSPISVPLIFDRPMVVFPAHGRYEWVVELDGEVAERIPLTVAPPPGLQFAAAMGQQSAPPAPDEA